MLFSCLCLATATALAAGGPELPGLATPVVNLDGAFKVLLSVARSRAAAAAGPVHLVDLPQSNIIAAVGVLVAGMGVATRLVLDDALAAGLTPVVLGTPGGDIDLLGTAANIAVLIGVVGLSKSTSNKSEKNNKNKLVHFYFSSKKKIHSSKRKNSK